MIHDPYFSSSIPEKTKFAPCHRLGRVNVLRHVLIASIWCVFFVVTPNWEIIALSIVWVPLLIGREWGRMSRPGWLAGTAIRLGVVAAIALALFAPFKILQARSANCFLDRHHVTLPSTRLTLKELAEAQVGPFIFPREAMDGNLIIYPKKPSVLGNSFERSSPRPRFATGSFAAVGAAQWGWVSECHLDSDHGRPAPRLNSPRTLRPFRG